MFPIIFILKLDPFLSPPVSRKLNTDNIRMSCSFKAVGSIVDCEKIWECLNISGKLLFVIC